MWNCNIATSTHKNFNLGCLFFYRQRYSGLPRLQNKCFQFLNLLDTKGILFFKWWSLNCQMMLDPNSAGTSRLSVSKDQIIGVVTYYRCYHFTNWTSARRRGSLSNNNTRNFCPWNEGFVVWSCSVRRISKDDATNPPIKAQACCITKKCWRAFCMFIWNETRVCCDVTYPHIANIFLGGHANLRLTLRLILVLIFGLMSFLSGTMASICSVSSVRLCLVNWLGLLASCWVQNKLWSVH